jgi:hypothetical protein
VETTFSFDPEKVDSCDQLSDSGRTYLDGYFLHGVFGSLGRSGTRFGLASAILYAKMKEAGLLASAAFASVLMTAT